MINICIFKNVRTLFLICNNHSHLNMTTKSYKTIRLLAIIILCSISCIRADCPLKLGEGFYCFKNEIYYSKHGQAIDKVFAECVNNFNYDDNYIVLIKMKRDYPSDTLRNNQGLYAEVYKNGYSLLHN